MPRTNVRKSRVPKKAPAKKPAYTKTAVNNAYREVQTKMRKEVTKLQKIKNPMGDAGIKRIQSIGMKARADRTKAISAAAKKHGVPKSQITAKKPINPGEIASKMSKEMRKKYRAYLSAGPIDPTGRF